MRPLFSDKFLKAVNDWQAGSHNKAAKAAKLRHLVEAENIESYLRLCEDSCYRRAVLRGPEATELFFEFAVSEETSAWSTKINVVENHRGGPPDVLAPEEFGGRPQAGVIYKHIPIRDEVVLNLDRLYQHPSFPIDLAHWKANGLSFAKGIDKFRNTQREVILSVDKVPHDEIYAFGSNVAHEWAEGRIGGLEPIGPTTLTACDVERLTAVAGNPTRRWLTGKSAKRVYFNFLEAADARLTAAVKRHTHT